MRLLLLTVAKQHAELIFNLIEIALVRFSSNYLIKLFLLSWKSFVENENEGRK
jgi:hypothetical protein